MSWFLWIVIFWCSAEVLFLYIGSGSLLYHHLRDSHTVLSTPIFHHMRMATMILSQEAYTVSEVESISPSFPVIFALTDGFSIVLYTNTHNAQSMNCRIHKCMGICLILKFGTILRWNGFILHCGAKSSINNK